MAIVLGNNCGFVTVRPVVDPSGSAEWFQTKAAAFKDTTPAGAGKIVEIGWWCDNATEEANFEVGIYEHNVGDNNPEILVGKSAPIAKGTGSGWKVVTGLNILVDSETIYWIALQLDDTASATYHNYLTNGAYKWDSKLLQTELEDPWGVSGPTQGRMVAYYALWELAAENQQAMDGKISRRSICASVVPGLY